MAEDPRRRKEPSVQESEGSDEEEEEEGTEGEEGDEEEEEDDEEPKLKYQRIGGSIGEIFKTDAASCMAVAEKLLALGTHYGLVYVLDFQGHIIRRFAQHQATVNELCIDVTGEYVSSCGNDGKVYINSLYGNETIEHSFKRPVTSIALDPDYCRKKTNQFACGGKAGQLILNTKGKQSLLLPLACFFPFLHFSTQLRVNSFVYISSWKRRRGSSFLSHYVRRMKFVMRVRSNEKGSSSSTMNVSLTK